MEQSNELEMFSDCEDELLLKDTSSLLYILPDEIWEKVTTNLLQRHKQDTIGNLSNSSPFYRNQFFSQRTAFLFGQVVNILVTGNYLRQLSDVLNCRQVCKVWNDEIDKVLGKQNCKLRLNKLAYRFGSYYRLLEFHNHFKDTHWTNGRSPFIGTTVTLHAVSDFIFPRPHHAARFGLVSTFFQKYGCHIKTFSIIFHTVPFRRLKVGLERLRGWLLEMENLVKLRVINDGTFLAEDYTNFGPFLTKSFPKLNNLEELFINTGILDEVNRNLIENNNHITKLTLATDRTSFIQNNELSKIPVLPNLTDLSINLNIFPKVKNLKTFPHLSTLTINLDSIRQHYDPPKWSKIFSTIETEFGSTLERLSLEMRGDVKDTLLDTKTYQLDLPKLKEIRLLVNNTSVSLNFLFPMKDSIERICVIIFGVGTVEGGIIKTLGFQDIRTDNTCGFLKLAQFKNSFEQIKDFVKSNTNNCRRNIKAIGDKLIIR